MAKKVDVENMSWADAPPYIEDDGEAPPPVVEAPPPPKVEKPKVEQPKLPYPPKTFKLLGWKPNSGESLQLIVDSKTDVAEVLPYLSEYNERMLKLIRNKYLSKTRDESLWPTPITAADIQSDIEVSRARAWSAPEGLTKPYEAGKHIVSWSLDENRLRKLDDDEPMDEDVIVRGNNIIGVTTGQWYKAAETLPHEASMNMVAYIISENGTIRWPVTDREYLLWRVLMNEPVSDIFAVSIPTDASMKAFERREEVFARFKEMLSRTPEITLMGVLPTHLQAAGTEWGVQRRGEVLRHPMSSNPIKTREGGLTVYSDVAWLVWVKLNGQTLNGRVYIKEDGRFIISQWCQREVSKAHGTEAYGGATMQHTLLTWLLGPGFSRNGGSYGPSRAGEKYALRPYKPLPSIASLDYTIGEEKAADIACFLYDTAKSYGELAGPTRIRPKSKFPCIYCATSGEMRKPFELPKDQDMGSSPWTQFFVSIVLPVGTGQITGSWRRSAVRVSDMVISRFEVKDAALKWWEKHPALQAAQESKDPTWLYNGHLQDPDEQKALLELLGVGKLHPIAETQAAIIEAQMNTKPKENAEK